MIQKNQLHQNPNFKNNLILIIATGFGLGLMPIAPGTFGTIIGVLIHLLTVFFLPAGLVTVVLLIALLSVSIANNMLTPWAQKYWKNDDPKNFILDEIAGYLIVPILFHQGTTWQIALWGFVLFRIFDIIKIPPARQIDKKMKNAWGILLDDIVSGLYAVATLHLLSWLNLYLPANSWLSNLK